MAVLLQKVILPETYCDFLRDQKSKINNAERISDLCNILSFDDLKLLLLRICENLPEDKKKHEENWFYYISPEEHSLCTIKRFDDTFVVLERHKIDNVFLCIRNDINKSEYTPDDWNQKIKASKRFHIDGCEDIQAAFYCTQITELEESTDIYATFEQSKADLWIELNKTFLR